MTPLSNLVAAALAEDIGTGDITAEATVPAGTRARATIVQKADGVISGMTAAVEVFRQLDPDCALEAGPEGRWRERGATVMSLAGNARALLAGERTALNFLQRLSGIATLTARVVHAIGEAGGTARVLDTRKTTPGLRALEKAAVAHGGATNHRVGLFDAILIKENHIAMAGGVGRAVAVCRSRFPELHIEVEVRDEIELREALAARADRVLLDNMTPAEIAASVALVGGRMETEASGGISPDNVLVYATIKGLDYLSMGHLTHSAPALDLSLLLSLEASPHDSSDPRERPRPPG